MHPTQLLSHCPPGQRDYRFFRLLLATATTLWFGAGNRQLAVLFFHRVRPCRDPLFPGEPDRTQFAETMEVLAQCFHCVPLAEAVQRLLAGRSLPPRAVAITFDDGYADNYTQALPVLQQYKLTATIFVASGFVDGGCMWHDEVVERMRAYPEAEIDLRPLGLGVRTLDSFQQRAAAITAVKEMLKYQPETARQEALGRWREIIGVATSLPDLMLSSEQVRRLHEAGMEIGGHTLSHPILACVDDRQARHEIADDRERLAAITGVAPTLFAYPNGKPGPDYSRDHAEMARAAGYRAAFTTVKGVAGPGVDPFQIPRFTPWDREPRRFALRLASRYIQHRFAPV